MGKGEMDKYNRGKYINKIEQSKKIRVNEMLGLTANDRNNI